MYINTCGEDNYRRFCLPIWEFLEIGDPQVTMGFYKIDLNLDDLVPLSQETSKIMCICIYMCVHMDTYVRILLCMYMYIYIESVYIYIYTYLYIYIYAYSWNRNRNRIDCSPDT